MHRILLVILSLTLGLATTIAIAWLLAVLPHQMLGDAPILLAFVPPDNRHTYRPPSVEAYAAQGWTTIAAHSAHVMIGQHGEFEGDFSRHFQQALLERASDKPLEQLIPRWAVADARRVTELDVGTVRPARLFVYASGWPLPAMACVIDDVSGGVKVTDGMVVTSEWLSRRTGSPGTVFNLPLRVLWKGAVVDTVVYGAMWGALIAAMLELRRRLRLRCGLCPRCAYNLKDQPDPGCPECGWKRAAPVPKDQA